MERDPKVPTEDQIMTAVYVYRKSQDVNDFEAVLDLVRQLDGAYVNALQCLEDAEKLFT